MNAPTKGTGTTWVGRAIRRLEDPALVRGRGRFTADLPAAYFVRFVRSPVAAGRIVKIAAPSDGSASKCSIIRAIEPGIGYESSSRNTTYFPVASAIAKFFAHDP